MLRYITLCLAMLFALGSCRKRSDEPKKTKEKTEQTSGEKETKPDEDQGTKPQEEGPASDAPDKGDTEAPQGGETDSPQGSEVDPAGSADPEDNEGEPEDSPVTTTRVLNKADVKPDMIKEGVLTLPEEFTEIAANVFWGRKDIRQVVAPKLRKIGDKAFRECSSLVSFKAPLLESIGSNCFMDCINLQEFTARKLKYIGGQAFYANMRLKKLRLGKTPPTGVQADAFRYSTGAKILVLAPGANAEDFASFAGQHRFASIQGSTLSLINYNSLPSGSQTEGDKLISLGEKHLGEFTLDPKYKVLGVGNPLMNVQDGNISFFSAPGAESLGAKALYDFSNIRALDLPKVKIIGASGVARCSRLEYVNAPAVEELGERAFELCYRIVSLSLPSVKVIGDNALASCQKLRFLELGETPPNLSPTTFGSTEGNYAIPRGSITVFVPRGAKERYEAWRLSVPQIGNIQEL